MALWLSSPGRRLARTAGAMPDTSKDISLTFWVKLGTDAPTGGGALNYRTFIVLNTIGTDVDHTWQQEIWIGQDNTGLALYVYDIAKSPQDQNVYADESNVVDTWVGMAYRYVAATGTHYLYRRTSPTTMENVATAVFALTVNPMSEVYVGDDLATNYSNHGYSNIRLWNAPLSTEELLAELNVADCGRTADALEIAELRGVLDTGTFLRVPDTLDAATYWNIPFITGPHPPTNTTPATATLLAPGTQAFILDVTDAPTATPDAIVDGGADRSNLTRCVVWFAIDGIADDIFPAFTLYTLDPDNTENDYYPWHNIWVGTAADLAQHQMSTDTETISFVNSCGEDIFVNLPTTVGTRYYIRVAQPAPSLDRDDYLYSHRRGYYLVVKTVGSPQRQAKLGDFLIPDDTTGFPCAVIDPNPSDPAAVEAMGGVSGFINIPACEFAGTREGVDMMLGAFESTIGYRQAQVYRGETLPPGNLLTFGETIFAITSDGTYYYVLTAAYDDTLGPVSYVHQVDPVYGVVAFWQVQVGVTTGRCLAVYGTTAFFSNAVDNTAIYRFDLAIASIMTPLITGFPNEHISTLGELYVDNDDVLWVVYSKFLDDTYGVIRGIDTNTGSVLHTWTLPTEVTRVIRCTHDASAHNYIVWGTSHDDHFTSRIAVISLDTGEVVAMTGRAPIIGGSGYGGEPYGISNSCPIIRIPFDGPSITVTTDSPRLPAAPPTTPTLTIPTPGAPTSPGDCECCVASKLYIMNDALSKLGISKVVASLDENSVEAIQGNLHVEAAIRETLRSHTWAFATRYAKSADAVASTDSMALLGGTDMEPYNRDWTYCYRMPADCVMARRLVREGIGRKFEPSPAEFRKGRIWTGTEDNDTIVVYTNEADAVLEYTAYTQCVSDYGDPLFLDCVAWKLAVKMSPMLERAQKTAIDCEKLFMHALSRSGQFDAAEQQQRQAQDDDTPSWIRQR